MAVDTNRMIILKVKAEVPATPPQPGVAAAPSGVGSSMVMLTYELSPVEINPKLEPATFAYKLPAGSRRVAEIGADSDQPASPGAERATGPEGAHLLNRPIPEISGSDLAGKPVTMADLRGKTVLLFCWSMSGGEYCLLSLPIVQDLAEHFKNRPELVVLGITGDTEQIDVIKQLMERKNARFRNLLDPGRAIESQLQLGGVPTFIIVGTDGLVKWARLGAPPTLKDDLIREIEKALSRGAR
jgi:peroxiredoxin